MRRWIERGLLVVGLACLGACAWDLAFARIYQVVEGQRLDELLGESGGRGHGPRGGHADEAREEREASDPIGRIEIERVGIAAIIAEGTDPRTLQRAVGHVPASALPGQQGNVVLAGHRDSFFRPLKDVRAGDRVTITTPEGVFDYDIESTDVVGPDRTDLLIPSNSPSLTLITCYPFYFIGPAPDRFVVRARPSPGAMDGLREIHRSIGLLF